MRKAQPRPAAFARDRIEHMELPKHSIGGLAATWWPPSTLRLVAGRVKRHVPLDRRALPACGEHQVSPSGINPMVKTSSSPLSDTTKKSLTVKLDLMRRGEGWWTRRGSILSASLTRLISA